MKLEEAIQQKSPFKSARHRAMVNVLYTANWLDEVSRAALAPYEITPQQFNVLRILRGAKGPLSTSAIRERMLDKSSDTSRMVDRLVDKQLVVKKICPADKRMVDIIISDKGLKLLSQIDDTAPLDSLMAHLNEEEAILLGELLDKLRTDE